MFKAIWDDLLPCGIEARLVLTFDVLGIAGVIFDPATYTIGKFRDPARHEVVNVE